MIQASKRLTRILMACALVAGLAGCAKKPPLFVPKLSRASVEEVRGMMVRDLEKTGGVSVIKTNTAIQVIMPDDFLFVPGSSVVSKKYALWLIAKLIETYDKVDIRVAVYLDNRQTLATQQAQTVANFLWAAGINARMLYAVGHGDLGWSDQHASALSRSFNHRVEISFRYYPKYKSYN